MSLNHFLPVLSASLNLPIISITGTQFRKSLMLMLGIRRTNAEFSRTGTVPNFSQANESFEMRSIQIQRSNNSLLNNVSIQRSNNVSFREALPVDV